MREIKFRAYDKKFNVMLNDVVVYNANNIIMVDVAVNEAYGDSLDQRLEDCEDAGPEHYCLTGEFDIMQFTGLKDKNGIDIFEGDIIKIDWKSVNSTDETISYDDNYAYFKYGT